MSIPHIIVQDVKILVSLISSLIKRKRLVSEESFLMYDLLYAYMVSLLNILQTMVSIWK